MVRQATDCQEIDTKHMSEKGVLARYIKSIWNLVTRKAIQFLRSKDVSKHFKNKTCIANKHMRRWPKSFVSRAVQVKNMSRYRCTPFELVFVPCGCYNNFPVWLKMTEIDSPTVWKPEVQDQSATVLLRSRQKQGRLMLGSSLPWWLLALRGLWPLLCFTFTSPLLLCVRLSYEDT